MLAKPEGLCNFCNAGNDQHQHCSDEGCPCACRQTPATMEGFSEKLYTLATDGVQVAGGLMHNPEHSRTFIEDALWMQSTASARAALRRAQAEKALMDKRGKKWGE